MFYLLLFILLIAPSGPVPNVDHQYVLDLSASEAVDLPLPVNTQFVTVKAQYFGHVLAELPFFPDDLGNMMLLYCSYLPWAFTSWVRVLVELYS